MKLPRVRFTIRRLMLAVAAAAMVVVFGMNFVTDYQSSHLCHNRRVRNYVSILGIPFGRHATMTTRFPTGLVHAHEWYGYSDDIRSLLGFHSRGCRINVYADSSAAPDGYQ